ncbi:protein disulfide-isomerase [Malassezia obtusa]|uniref:protein disulfide-isomerase n=1 Tax=Malassezia obtusa TaxID=76774 RepID=A0AAF0DZ02_9BASI|nr:protein disulfide-isomerase [Malassezia obtusa]
MRAFTQLALAATLAAVGVFAADEKSNVESLTATTFKKWVANEPLALVEFFAPWCGHCQALAPHYEAAATELLANNVKLAKVDCTQEESLCTEQEIGGFPTLKVFRNGTASPYGGTRKKEGIVSYMLKQQLPAVSTVTPENLEELKKKDHFVLVGYVEENDKASAEALHKYAEEHRDSHVVGISHDKSLASKAGAKFPSLVAYRTFDDPEVVHAAKGKALTGEEIESFASVESLPLIDEISAENFAKYALSGLPLAYYFVEPESPTREEEVKKLAQIAKDVRGKVNMVWIDAKKFGSHAMALNLKGEKWPAFVVQDMENGAKYPLELGKDIVGGVKTFMQQFVGGKLKPSIKSGPIPEKQGAVIEVVADEFDKYVFNDDRDVLLELYAPWCGHCKNLAPTYEKLAEAYAATPDAAKRVSIVKMDGTANDIPPHADITLQGFPTILLKPAGKGSRTFESYEGDRTLESLIEFVSTKGTHKAAPKPVAESSNAHDEL